MDDACPRCGDTGWLVTEREGMSGAERCSCYGRRANHQRYAAANIPTKFAEVDLQNFQTSPGLVSNAYVAVRGYTTGFPILKKPGLLLAGGTGSGKHILPAALKLILAKGFDGLFVDYQELIERIQKGWSQEAGEEQKQAYQRALDVEVLVLDDLGAQRNLDWVQDTVTAIITHRYNHNKPLIATTNLPDPTLGSMPRMVKSLGEVVGERARSRLLEMCTWVNMTGIEDRRERVR
ncbi:MAG: ATP-binding protein [Bryobacteraceae bacterium]